MHSPVSQIPEAQILPQRPQCASSALRSTSQPSTTDSLQSASPTSQTRIAQRPLAQSGTAPGTSQVRPHSPHVFGSKSVSASHPFSFTRSQSMKPPSHVAMAHSPAGPQRCRALGRAQGVHVFAPQPTSTRLSGRQTSPHALNPSSQTPSSSIVLSMTTVHAPAMGRRSQAACIHLTIGTCHGCDPCDRQALHRSLAIFDDGTSGP